MCVIIDRYKSFEISYFCQFLLTAANTAVDTIDATIDTISATDTITAITFSDLSP